jgi:hypothetical protein
MHAYAGHFSTLPTYIKDVPKYPLPYFLPQNFAAHTEILIFVQMAFIYSIKSQMTSLDLTKSLPSSLSLPSVL